jgi:hypothetical protein
MTGDDIMTTDKLAFIRADIDALRKANLLIIVRTMSSPASVY